MQLRNRKDWVIEDKQRDARIGYMVQASQPEGADLLVSAGDRLQMERSGAADLGRRGPGSRPGDVQRHQDQPAAIGAADQKGAGWDPAAPAGQPRPSDLAL